MCNFSSSDLDNGSAVATAHVRAYSLNRGFMSTTALPIKPAQLAPNGSTLSEAPQRKSRHISLKLALSIEFHHGPFGSATKDENGFGCRRLRA